MNFFPPQNGPVQSVEIEKESFIPPGASPDIEMESRSEDPGTENAVVTEEEVSRENASMEVDVTDMEGGVIEPL